MLSILGFCHSYFLRLDQKADPARAKPYPPLATLQVVSLLREAGHRVSCFLMPCWRKALMSTTGCWSRTHPQLVLFYEDNFNFLSIRCAWRPCGGLPAT